MYAELSERTPGIKSRKGLYFLKFYWYERVKACNNKSRVHLIFCDGLIFVMVDILCNKIYN